MNALHFLKALDAEFPLTTMGPEFAGAHSLTVHNGELHANIWWNGQAWFAKITGDALMDEPKALCAFLKTKLAELHAAGPPGAPAAPGSPSPISPPPSGDSGLKAE